MRSRWKSELTDEQIMRSHVLIVSMTHPVGDQVSCLIAKLKTLFLLIRSRAEEVVANLAKPV